MSTDNVMRGSGNRSRRMCNYSEEKICRLGNELMWMEQEVSRVNPRLLVHCKTGRTMMRKVNKKDHL